MGTPIKPVVDCPDCISAVPNNFGVVVIFPDKTYTIRVGNLTEYLWEYIEGDYVFPIFWVLIGFCLGGGTQTRIWVRRDDISYIENVTFANNCVLSTLSFSMPGNVEVIVNVF